MKKIGNFFWTAGILAALALASAACTGERDTPLPPETSLRANITIEELIDRHRGQSFAAIDTALYIEGVVTANDISGNIYKKIFVQDSTAGIDIEIEMTNNHQKYPIGQRLVIDLKGLAYGEYNGQPQIGAQGENVTERLYEPECDDHFHRQGYASVCNVPEPVNLTVNMVNFIGERDYLGMFIRIDSVRFDSAGCVFVDQEAAALTGNAVNLLVRDVRNPANTLDVRISSYALFATELIPYGVGSIQGVLGVYRGELQFFPRMQDDLIGFWRPPLEEAGENVCEGRQ